MQVRDYAGAPAAPPAVPPVPATPQNWSPPPPPPRPKSRLGWLALSVAAVAVGALGLTDLAGAPVSGSAYVALLLAVAGAGLVVGAWYGRARWLIAPGVVLTIALGMVSAAERVSSIDHSVTWRPTSVAQLDGGYTTEIGNAVLDLSAIDFTGLDEAVEVRVGVGNLRVTVPSNVDVRVEAKVDVGNATVFSTRWGGIGQSARTVSDDGADGPGGGQLVIRATVDVGDLEVGR